MTVLLQKKGSDWALPTRSSPAAMTTTVAALSPGHSRANGRLTDTLRCLRPAYTSQSGRLAPQHPAVSGPAMARDIGPPLPTRAPQKNDILSMAHAWPSGASGGLIHIRQLSQEMAIGITRQVLPMFTLWLQELSSSTARSCH